MTHLSSADRAAAATASSSSSASVRGSSRSSPSCTRASTGGSPVRRARCSSAGGTGQGDDRPVEGEERKRSAAHPALGPAHAGAGADCGGQALRPAAQRRLLGAEHGQCGDLGSGPGRVAVQPQCRLERGERELVDPQRAGERVRPRCRHRLRAADEQAGLRSAEQLVSRAAHERRPRGHRARHRRFVLHRDQRTRPDVVDDRHSELAQRFDRNLGDEAEGAEVRRVHAHDRPHVLAQRAGVISQPGPVRRAHLDQPGTRLGDDLRDAKAPADLDQLPARDDDRPPRAGQGGSGQKHRGGPVVDHHGGLGTGQLAQQRLDVIVAAAALAAVEVQFEVAVAAGDPGHGRLRARGERGAAEVRVHDHPGGVENRAQRGHLEGGEQRPRAVGHRALAWLASQQGLATFVDRPPRRRHRERAGRVELGRELMDGGQLSQERGRGT